jgi:glycosyltransferase involved in cell wall biosynthesis
MYRPTVSVIIPTVNRPAVREAVLSVLNQTYPAHEIIVAVDRPDKQIPSALDDLRDKISIVFSGGIGVAGARTRAMEKSTGEVVAFLDDDDQFVPEKLERQLAMWPTGDDAKRHTFISCRFVMVAPDGELLRSLPRRIIAPGESLANYVFRRTTIRYAEGAINPSTLICDRDLFNVEPWNEQVLLHEDWDWMLRLDLRDDVDILMSTEVLLRVKVGDAGSLSRSSKWERSFLFAQQHAEFMTPRELGDFLLAVTATLAIWAGKRGDALRIARYALTKARPGRHAWLVWAITMLPAGLVDRASLLFHRFFSEKLPPSSNLTVGQADPADGSSNTLGDAARTAS